MTSASENGKEGVFAYLKSRGKCQPILMFETVLCLKSFDNFQLYLLFKKILLKYLPKKDRLVPEFFSTGFT